MKRFLISLIACVCVSIGAWADDAKFNVTHSGGDVTVNFVSDGTYTVSTVGDAVTNGFTGTLYITGTVGVDDVEALLNKVFGSGQYSSWGKSIDMSAATIEDIDNLSGLDIPGVKRVILPSNTSSITSSMVSLFTSWGQGGSALMYIIIDSCPVQVYASKDTSTQNYDSNISPYVSSVFSDCSNAVVTGYNEAAINNAVSLLEEQDVTIPKSTSITCSASELAGKIQECIDGNISVTAITITSGTLSDADKTAISNLIDSGLADNLKSLDLTGATGSDISTYSLPESLETVYLPNGTTSIPSNVSALASKNLKIAFAYAEDANGNVTSTVLPTVAGGFKAFHQANAAKFPGGATIKFANGSKLNEDDFTWLSINEHNNPRGTNSYYVDMFDIDVNAIMYDSKKIEDVIASGVNTMRAHTNNGSPSFFGLILPKNVNTLGTTLIQDRVGDTDPQPTSAQFIAYYNNTSTEGEQVTVGHVYDYNTNASAYTTNFNKMMAMLNAHSEVSGTTIYQISTNSPTEFPLTSLATSTTRIETYNNEMVKAATKATMHVYTDEADALKTAVDNTGIENTPVEKLVIDGPVSDDDLKSIASFAGASTPGPRVLDLSKVPGGVTEAQLKLISNSAIEYLVLPKDADKDVIFADYTSKMPNLKAVINAANNSTSHPSIIANVLEAGKLYEARCHALGLSISTDGNYYLTSNTTFGVTSVTLKGNLNAADINTGAVTVGSDGHFKATGAEGTTTSGLLGETVTTLDLTEAVFATQTDMNFSGVGLSSLSDVKLPTSREMTLIGDRCFNGMQSLKELCVPYNYTKFGNAVFLDSYLEHLTTTDSEGALIDNGPKTYTFSKNLQEIGNDPGVNEDGVKALSEIVFPQNRGVTDVYVLAHKVPKCYANAFPANMLYGWGGFKGGDFPYCREKYDNSSDGSLIFTVLHFPDEASFNAAAANMKETITSTDADAGLGPDAYTKMRQLYTDINKIYSMKEQTGAVDANGKAIAWPTFSELRRTYNQATEGLTWNDWSTEYDTNHEVNGGDNIPSKATSIPAGNGNGDYSFTDYEGWHQFTLALATYVAPDETNVEDGVITREYVETDQWYTFCIPFSITADQLKEILGVPASTDKVINKVYKKNGTTVVDEVSAGHNPEVRTLNGVVRTPGTPNTVIFSFTQPLVVDGNEEYKYLEIKDENPSQTTRSYVPATTEGNVPVAIQGGRPYIVKPYKLKGESFTNLGKYVMERFGKEFKEYQSSANISPDFYEQLGNRGKVTSQFVKPYEKHKIQAFLNDNDDNTAAYTTHADGKKYYYTFIGQYWEQDLPRYSFYVVGGKWYRYSSGNKNYKWAPYKCIIMASQEVNDDLNNRSNGSGKYRAADRSVIPTVTQELKDDDVFDKEFKLGFLNGLDDDDFDVAPGTASGARHIFELDGDIIEYDEEGNEVTGIKTLDGEDITPLPANLKVYNLNGQFVGSSLEALDKGMYIVNGKKIVVN